MSEYTNTPDQIRITFDQGEWFLDGANAEDQHTENCWSYPTLEEAVSDVSEFVRHTAMNGIVWPEATKI